MAEPQSANADQIAYWNSDVGARWVAQQEALDAMLAGATAALLAAAKPARGTHILDVGCGCGTTALHLAKDVGSEGRVTGVDISAPMLAHARKRASGLSNLQFDEADAATYRGAPADLIVSRFGVMFFADPVSAFANLHRNLKPKGRMVFVCWRDWRLNEWVRVPVGAVRPHVPAQPPLGPDEPGPFAFASLERMRGILEGSGFAVMTAAPVDNVAAFGATLDESVAYLSEVGPVSRMLGPASPAERTAALANLRESLAPFAATGPVKLGLAQWLVTASRL